jgi:Na+-translocating ferredoxin:NAD+ oxidoreductase subunit B
LISPGRRIFLSIIIPILVISGLGSFIGLLLAIADKKLSVETNPLIDEVLEVLPMGNCANCGYSGCSQYAEAVVLNPEVPPDLCTPGGNDTAAKVAVLTHKKAGEIKAVKAVAQCGGCAESGCSTMFTYSGLEDCNAAAQLFDGEKVCEFGCIGFGNCARVCPYGAITMNGSNLPEIDAHQCIGCGLCEKECPRNVISLIPANAVSIVLCKNQAKGALTRKACNTGCIACRKCMKACPHGAINIVNNLCVIDYEKCQFCDDPPCLNVECMPGVIHPAFGMKTKKPAAETTIAA